MTDAAIERRMPELAVVSVLAHAGGERAAASVEAVSEGFASIDRETAVT